MSARTYAEVRRRQHCLDLVAALRCQERFLAASWQAVQAVVTGQAHITISRRGRVAYRMPVPPREGTG